MEVFLGLLMGILVTVGLVVYLKYERSKRLAQSQSVIILDKIKKVCKLITVEGDFAEIYHYEHVKERFLKLLSSKKKALVVINAKAHVGYDFSKIKLTANPKKKTVVLHDFPQPEVLSVETDLNYYDKKDGMFNKFEAADLTELHKETKLHILEKIPESNLFTIAQSEALETILLIENIVQTIGWKLDYSALKIDKQKSKLLE
tara:strand:- start:144348 stop:144956 length:609 start_codon:yes stop_codon:yes gene_type:complete